MSSNQHSELRETFAWLADVVERDTGTNLDCTRARITEVLDGLEEQFEGALKSAYDAEKVGDELRRENQGLKEQLESLRAAVEAFAEQVFMLPVQRHIGANYNVQTDTVAAAPVEAWEALCAVLSPASRPSMYEGTPLPHGISCRCSDCAPAER